MIPEKKTTEIQGGLNFENAREWKKNTEKFQGNGESFDGIPESKVSENGYPQQAGTDYFWKSPIYVIYNIVQGTKNIRPY